MLRDVGRLGRSITGCDFQVAPGSRKKRCCTSDRKTNCYLKSRAAQKKSGSGTMKKIMALIVGILFVGAITVALSTSTAIAGPHGHHGHHGGHHGKFIGPLGFGPSPIVGTSSTVVEEQCPMVKSCYVNKFGEKRCKWVPDCD